MEPSEAAAVLPEQEVDVGIYWDLENVQPPGTKAAALVHTANQLAASFGNVVERVGFTNGVAFSELQRSALLSGLFRLEEPTNTADTPLPEQARASLLFLGLRSLIVCVPV